MPQPDLYQRQTELYDLLVSREDHHGRLMPAVEALLPLTGRDVVEAGAGTGRLTFLLARKASRVRAFDVTEQMLHRAELRRRREGIENCSFAQGDTRSLPVESASADLAIEGWSVLQMADWVGSGWEDSVDQAEELIGFFFGEAMAREVRRRNSPVVPECTGLWWRRI